MEEKRGERSELDRHAATRIAAELRQCAEERGSAVLGVVGGRSVAGIYRELTLADLPWDRIHVFLADERLVNLTAPDSNWKVVHGALLQPLLESGRLPPDNAHPFHWRPDVEDQGIGAYASELGGIGGRFDAVVLSAGEDGHTASLFPGHAALDAHAEHFVHVRGAPKPPPERLSASRELLEASGLSVLTFYGDSKATALARFRDDAVSVTSCLCKLVRASAQAWIYSDC